MKAMRVAAVALTVSLTTLASTAAADASTVTKNEQVKALEASLGELQEALTWKGSAAATYPAVDEAVDQALDDLSRIQREHRSAVPQAATFRNQLQRLASEADYFVRVTSQPGYAPGVLDTVANVQAGLKEWGTETGEIRRDLRKPSTLRPGRPAAAPSLTIVDERTRPGTVFSDVRETNAMDLVVVPSGSYTAGATAEEHESFGVPKARRHFELRQKVVTVGKPLAVGRTEVTVGQFKQFVKETGYQPAEGMRAWLPNQDSLLEFRPKMNYLNPGFPQTDDDPVVGITKNDAEAFAAWMSERTGKKYRLPTEGEWEYFARAGSQTPFFWGNDVKDAGRYANTYDEDAYAANRFSIIGSGEWAHVENVHDGFTHTAPVGSFKPNAFGLYDVTGNAREFVADTWVDSQDGATTDASVREGEAPFVVLRGGAWAYQPQNLRVAYRNGYLSSETRTNMFGFRLVREL
ncbi:formylglycine-generating enzyme family protein [Streptomyces jeddahensis]|uniref:Serine/threonine-protein kinase pkn1 n=1 Tax=Streptomyces jeddahensis TaxID=1716141 RepID=A0A177HM08_9ACTN|nr:SUMF1/EgtB/PvdO family nonheme iron enzyme [Streptomyces jeddahensis]OAH11786.1 serine/threonine-protein kinase pkn1 [Streptomyces jeddahensis]